MSLEEIVEADRVLEGLEDREGVVREGVEGLDEDDERMMGEDGLI